MNTRELKAYDEQQRQDVIEFFDSYKGDLPNVGCEKIVMRDKFLSTSLERIKQPHTSADFVATMRRLKKIKQIIESGTNS